MRLNENAQAIQHASSFTMTVQERIIGNALRHMAPAHPILVVDLMSIQTVLTISRLKLLLNQRLHVKSLFI